MSKQLFGWTNPETSVGGYVGYAMAHEEDDGTITLSIRPHGDKTGNAVSINLPAHEAYEFANAIKETLWVRESRARQQRLHEQR